MVENLHMVAPLGAGRWMGGSILATPKFQESERGYPCKIRERNFLLTLGTSSKA